jgi:hypothetical protein
MSELKVNKISPRSGTDVTLGDSGDTFTLGSGANIAGLTLSDNILFDTASKGIYLGVTSATASNLLDDYEEGTWTPALSISSSDASGYYTVTGNIVHAYFKITATTTGNNITINNFPFATKGSTPDVVGGARETQTSGRFYQIVASQSNTSAYIFRYDNSNSISSGMVFQGSLIYQKA